MPSKKQLNQLNINQEDPEIALDDETFIARNQQAFNELLTFIDFTDEQLTIGFVEINFATDREILINTLKKPPHCEDIQFIVFNFTDTNLRFFRNDLVIELNKITIEPNKKLVIIITGLGKSIGTNSDYPPALQNLNFISDAITNNVHHPVIFFLPNYAITRLAKYAPNFWALHRGICYFKATEATKNQALEKTLQSQSSIDTLELPEKQARIELLESLLMEYNPSNHNGSVGDIRTRLLILLEIGRTYISQGEYFKAKQYLEAAEKIVNAVDELDPIKSSVLYKLGIVEANMGQVEKAIAYYQQSLAIDDYIGNKQGKGSTLHQLAGIYANLGQIEKAITLYQQSLEIFEQIEDVQGKATTLHQLAGIYADSGQIEAAIAYYQQSLELKERVGNVQGKAATLHQLAGIYANSGQIEAALAYYQNSLELFERIGDVEGKAATLHELAGIYANSGQVEEARAYYHQVLEIDEHSGNVQGKAATLHQLATLHANSSQTEEAITLFQQSLALKERVGDVLGKAMTLSCLGYLAQQQGNVEKAREYLQESLEILQRFKSPDAEKVREMLADVQKRV